jgi:hypothetical protein
MNEALITKFTLPALGAVAFLLAGVPARATAVLSDTLTICQNGQNCVLLTAPETSEGQFFVSDLNIGDSAQADSLDGLLLHGSFVYETSGGGTISDIFGVAKVQGGTESHPTFSYQLYFVSDPGPDHLLSFANLLLPNNPNDCDSNTFHCFDEGNGTFNLNGLLSASAVRLGYTATFQSDTESTVPEPGGVGVLLGLGSLGLCAWKRRKTA